MKKNIWSIIGVIALFSGIIVFALNIVSSAIYILVLLAIALLAFGFSVKSEKNNFNKIGATLSTIIFVVAILLYLFALNME